MAQNNSRLIASMNLVDSHESRPVEVHFHPFTDDADDDNSPLHDDNHSLHEPAQAASYKELLKSQTLDQIYKRYGFDSEDELDPAQQLMLFKETIRALESEMKRLSDASQGIPDYDRAVELRGRLKKLKVEFSARQESDRKKKHLKEQRKLEEGRRALLQQDEKNWKQAINQLQDSLDKEHQRLAELHNIQAEHLERDIAHVPMPPVVFSSRLQDMKSTQKELAKSLKFEEAKEVAHRISQLEPKEQDAYRQNFLNKQELRRQALHKQQESESQELKQRGLAHQWAMQRKKESSRQILTKRIDYSAQAMRHTHEMEHKQQYKTYTPKRPVVSERANGSNTTSAARGSQILRQAKGLSSNTAVPSLCQLHDFSLSTDPEY